MAVIEHFFSSYQDALAQCGAGYEDGDIPAVVGRKTVAILPMLRQMLLDPDPLAVSLMSVLTAAGGANPVKVLDVGGGCGYHFFALRALLPELAVIWHVVETKAMTAQARSLFDVDGLRFFSEIEDALAPFGGTADLVHSSSTIQYVPQPEDLVDQLVAVAARHLLIARFPIFDGPRIVGLQASRLADNGPGPAPEGTPDKLVHYPVTFCNKDDIAARLLRTYDITGQFASPSSNYRVGGSAATGASFLLRRRA